MTPSDFPSPPQGAVLPAQSILEKWGPEGGLPKGQDKRQRRCHRDQGAFLLISAIKSESQGSGVLKPDSHDPAPEENLFPALF